MALHSGEAAGSHERVLRGHGPWVWSPQLGDCPTEPDASREEAQKLPTVAGCVSAPRRQWEAGGSRKGVLTPHSVLPPNRCALLPTPPPRPPTSPMPSPCSPVSRLLRVSTVAAVAAQWPPRPRPPRRTSPTPPPAASRHPAGRPRPRPQGGHSTTSHSSRPCGLRHPLPQRQTGRPWPPNRPPQNRGPTPPWRPRDKGGPSPLPEARTLWGGGEDVSAGPLHPPLSAPPFPGALEGRDRTLVPAHRPPAREHGGAGPRHPACMDVVQSRLGAGGRNFTEQAAFPRGLARPAPPQGAAENRHSSGDLAGSCLGAPWGPAGLDPHPRECRAFSACVCVAVYVFICM